MNIRPACDDDDDAIWAMLNPVFRAGNTYTVPSDISRDAALNFWKSGHEVFLAEDSESPLGSYYICPNQKGGGAHVCNCGFVTANLAQGKGVARAMLEHALQHATNSGYRAMQFNFVVSANTRAIAIWERYGFQTIGRLPDAFLHPELGYIDALVMYRKLLP